ncbi:MAG: hypothetical protein KGJ34_01795 [Patescibacteria group bacterium]|nr:hypothetical protein [Patescibacteria group bacterium]
MKGNVRVVVAVIIAIVVIAIGIWYFNQGSAPTPATSNSATSTVATSSPTGASAANSATVFLTSNGFSPQSVTIAQGGTVTFINQTSGSMWIASDPHPIHNGYDGTTLEEHCAQGYTGPAPFDECSAGNSFSFTFSKVGSWGYHNHIEAYVQGVVNVVSSQ